MGHVAIDETLSRLQTDRVEFYFIHNFDGLTPIEETPGGFCESPIGPGRFHFYLPDLNTKNCSPFDPKKSTLIAQIAPLVYTLIPKLGSATAAR